MSAAGRQQDRPHGGVADRAALLTDADQHGRQEHGHAPSMPDQDRQGAAGLLAPAEEEQHAGGGERQGDPISARAVQ